MAGSYLSPQGAICISTEQVGWCLLLESFQNDGRSAVGTIISTFVENGVIWTGNHGSFHVVSFIESILIFSKILK